MNIITLAGFAGVQEAMAGIADNHPEWFPLGFNGIYAVGKNNMFAATVSGAIYFSAADGLVSGFKPGQDLVNAIAKSGTGELLTFNEEYAVETLWHELKHGIYRHKQLPENKKIKYAIEGLLQFNARHTYLDLLAPLKLTPSHQQAIIAGGYAYDVEVSNFRALLQLLKLDENTAVLIVDGVLGRNKNTGTVIQGMADALSAVTGHAPERIAYALKNLGKTSGFSEKVSHKLNY